MYGTSLRMNLQTAVDIARLGIPVYIVKAASESARMAMSGEEPIIGTIICLEKLCN